jgi:hypothetical protein
MPPTTTSQDAGMTWLIFALMTVVAWGVYGVFLHTGQMGMQDPVNGRYKAFLFVGFAYFLVAVIGPFLMLVLSGANWKYPVPGMAWSLIAGIAGAIGAFCVLLAFGAKGNPTVVMSIVFAGAPIVNAVVVLAQHPPEGGIGAIDYKFWLGILMAAIGGCFVTLYKPAAAAPAKKPGAALHATASAAPVAENVH